MWGLLGAVVLTQGRGTDRDTQPALAWDTLRCCLPLLPNPSLRGKLSLPGLSQSLSTPGKRQGPAGISASPAPSHPGS